MTEQQPQIGSSAIRLPPPNLTIFRSSQVDFSEGETLASLITPETSAKPWTFDLGLRAKSLQDPFSITNKDPVATNPQPESRPLKRHCSRHFLCSTPPATPASPRPAERLVPSVSGGPEGTWPGPASDGWPLETRASFFEAVFSCLSRTLWFRSFFFLLYYPLLHTPRRFGIVRRAPVPWLCREPTITRYPAPTYHLHTTHYHLHPSTQSLTDHLSSPTLSQSQTLPVPLARNPQTYPL